MKAPTWFRKELNLIDERYFVAFNPRRERWQIRMWLESHRPEDINTFERYALKSMAIMTVCFEDENTFSDIGYKPLDQRVLHSLRVSRRNADNPEAIMRDIDDWNAHLEEEFEEEVDYMMRDFSKSVWRHFREPMVDLGAI